jgi:hypothetical protein
MGNDVLVAQFWKELFGAIEVGPLTRLTKHLPIRGPLDYLAMKGQLLVQSAFEDVLLLRYSVFGKTLELKMSLTRHIDKRTASVRTFNS